MNTEYVIDALSICKERPGQTRLSILLTLLLELRRRGDLFFCVFDQSAFHEFNKRGGTQSKLYQQLRRHPKYFSQVRGQADVKILDLAERNHSRIISNDNFREHRAAYRWLQSDKDRLINVSVVKDRIICEPLAINVSEITDEAQLWKDLETTLVGDVVTPPPPQTLLRSANPSPAKSAKAQGGDDFVALTQPSGSPPATGIHQHAANSKGGAAVEQRIGTITETKAREQLGILVLDGSGSMSAQGETNLTKAGEVNIAVQGLMARLRISRLRENFYLAIITYDDQVNSSRLPPTPVTQVDPTSDYNPLHGHGNETAIGDALNAAASVAFQFLSEQQSFPRSVVIVLMTDGQNNCGQDPVEVANKIKNSGKRITICAAGYGKGDDVDALTLQKLVTDGNGYVRAYDPEVLRKFFEASISRVRG